MKYVKIVDRIINMKYNILQKYRVLYETHIHIEAYSEIYMLSEMR